MKKSSLAKRCAHVKLQKAVHILRGLFVFDRPPIALSHVKYGQSDLRAFSAALMVPSSR